MIDVELAASNGKRPRPLKTIDQPLERLSIVGASPAMRELWRGVKTVSRSVISVLIEGETGVGKNLIARAIHQLSPRSHGPFVCLNAPAVPGELFESELFGHVRGAFSGAYESHSGLASASDGGTLFIDEIGELSPTNQAKLLGFLDEKRVRPVGGLRATRVDLRLICATNRSLQREVEEGRFRRDLYYRVRVVALRVPALRERQGDLPLLVDHFLKTLALRHGRKVVGLSQGAFDALCGHAWEGNVRELENELERAVLLTPEGGRIEAGALSPTCRSPASSIVGAGASLLEARRTAERAAIEQALGRRGWNVSAAARDLRISRSNLTRKVRQLGLQRPGSRRQECGR